MTKPIAVAGLLVAALALCGAPGALAAEAAVPAAAAPAAAPAPAPGAAAPAAAPKADEVKASTAPAIPAVTSIYTVERLRDPFIKTAGGALVAAKPMTPEDFNIHNLSLKGIMKDSYADYALFSDVNFGASFILRRGQLLDYKGKAVPGVTGTLDIKQKSAHLITRDKDVQVFRLGEEEEKKEE